MKPLIILMAIGTTILVYPQIVGDAFMAIVSIADMLSGPLGALLAFGCIGFALTRLLER